MKRNVRWKDASKPSLKRMKREEKGVSESVTRLLGNMVVHVERRSKLQLEAAGYAPKAVSLVRATLVIRKVEWRQFVNKPDEYRKKNFSWQENEWRSDHILVLCNLSTIASDPRFFPFYCQNLAWITKQPLSKNYIVCKINGRSAGQADLQIDSTRITDHIDIQIPIAGVVRHLTRGKRLMSVHI